jgi:uncharacterized protein YkwD
VPAPVALGIAVFALLTAFGLGAALLPSSFTGPGTAAERPAAAVGALAPGAGGGVPGVKASTSAPDSAPLPSRSATPAPKASKPSSTAAKPKPKPTATRTRTATKSAAPQVAAGLTGQEDEVIRLTNIERDKAGCGAVKLNTKLRTAMRLHVRELGRRGDLYISHVSADGRSFVDRAKEQGYDAPGGENVARGQRDAADVMTSWMDSDGHRANILNCSFKAIGVGAVKGVDGTIVWGQIFGRA